ncbi:MAG TPA: hypothetical protein PKZ32_18585 [Candidatus Melainabacteria bacterium]|nr:hypothetical protein [Candidatus Melainabacteria bacterium]
MAGANLANDAFSDSLSAKMVADAGADKVAQQAAQNEGAAHSLWQAAYENPGKTALIVGGTALAVGAAIASRGKLAEMIPAMKNRVLVVEDSPFFGPAFKETLEQQGNRVTLITGAEDVAALKSGIVTAPGGKQIPLHLERYQAAFVDGDLVGNVTGAQVVKELSAKHVSSVGMSSQVAPNMEMLKEGAIAAELKPSVFGALVNRDISVRGVLKNPGEVQGKLDSYKRRYFEDSSIGDKASEILKKAMEKLGVG